MGTVVSLKKGVKNEDILQNKSRWIQDGPERNQLFFFKRWRMRSWNEQHYYIWLDILELRKNTGSNDFVAW